MDKDKIIQQGTVAKWEIDITRPDFRMDEDGFAVTLSWGFTGHNLTIGKDDMVIEDGKTTFTLDTTGIIGQINATCAYYIHHDEIDSRVVIDRQVIGFVVTGPCPKFQDCVCEAPDGYVTYKPIRQEGYTILYGSGQTYTECRQSAEVSIDLTGSYEVVVGKDGDKVFFVVPYPLTIASATMSNFAFPLNPPQSVTIDGRDFKVYESSNTYDAGTYVITIND